MVVMAKVKQIINIETNFKFIYVIRDCKMGFMEIDAPPILFYLLMDNNRVYIWGPSSLDDGTPKIGERLEDISSFLVTRITKEMVVEELASLQKHDCEDKDEAYELECQHIRRIKTNLPALHIDEDALRFLKITN